MIERTNPDLLLVFDECGVTGHPDHVRATEAALDAARSAHLPVVA
jgi:LmbE family N-acetylglucosaminyl deacetylase